MTASWTFNGVTRSDQTSVNIRDDGGSTIELVSKSFTGTQGDDVSGGGLSTSADGRFVSFWSYATNLVEGGTDGNGDVFVHDRQTGVTTRVSIDSTGSRGNFGRFEPSISGDGRYVAFTSYATIVEGNITELQDISVYDRQTGTTTRFSIDPAGTHEDSYSGGSSVSADGRFVAFISNASNVVEEETGPWGNVFISRNPLAP